MVMVMVMMTMIDYELKKQRTMGMLPEPEEEAGMVGRVAAAWPTDACVVW